MELKIFYFFNNLAGQWPVFDAAVVFLADYFKYLVVAAFLLLLFFSLLASLKLRRSGREMPRKMFWTAIISVVLSRFVIIEIIRFFYCRPRPFMVYIVNRLAENANCSFPSGHAAFFFALAMAIYFYNKKWGAWFFVAATLISVSRIVAGVHYPTDILGGAIIGVFSAYIVFRYFP